MRAAWYERQGEPQDVLVVGEMPDPVAGPGEVRIRVAASGINPGDVKKRGKSFGSSMAFPRIIPHSDGAGEVDQIGDGVEAEWMGRAVWCYGAQSYRPFGTAAEYTVVPAAQIVPLPAGVAPEQGACLGIPGITGHRAVHVAGPLNGRTVLVQGAAGAVGLCAVQLAQYGGARVIGTVRDAADEETARRAGAHEVFVTDDGLVEKVKAVAPRGVDHIVEVAFAANAERDLQMLRTGGSIATYATNDARAPLPFWPMVFQNVQVFFLGSDDFPPEAKAVAARDLNAALEGGWPGFAIGQRLPLSEIARAQEAVEKPTGPGRVVLVL